MPTFIQSILEHNSASNAAVDTKFVRGGSRGKVAGLDDLTAIPVDQVKPYATLVYVVSETKWYYNISSDNANGTGSASSVAADQWEVYFPGADGLTIEDGDAVQNNSSTIKFVDGSGSGIVADFDVSGDTDEMTIALKNAGGLTDSTITMWDSSNGQLVNSNITQDGNGDVTIDGDITVETINADTLNLTNEYTAASISTTDTFIRLADPSADPAAGSEDESEYARAQHAGLVINTGYFDEDFDNTGDAFALSTHKLLYWNKTLLKWVVQDGTPEVDDSTDPDSLINAENDLSNGVGRNAGTMKFVENFYLPDAQALHFGLDSIFAFDHFDGSNDPTVTSTTDEFIKTQWVLDRKVLWDWASFTLAAADIDGAANGHLTDVTWNDTDAGDDDDAANTMANTYIRTARVLKATVSLEGEDIETADGNATIKVYHGGVFEDEIPVVTVFRKTAGTVGTDATYEEIMTRVIVTDSEDYVEIVFNTGYLSTAPGTDETSSLYVRMVG